MILKKHFSFTKFITETGDYIYDRKQFFSFVKCITLMEAIIKLKFEHFNIVSLKRYFQKCFIA